MRDINEILNNIEEINKNNTLTAVEKKNLLEILGKELEEYEKTDINPKIKIIDEEILEEIVNKHYNNQCLQPNEIKILLDSCISFTWNSFNILGIKLNRTSLNGMCKLAQELSLKPLEQIGVNITKNSASKCFNYPQTHYFGTATFKINDKESKTYIIDPTYIQFYKEGMDKEFAKQLIENGYIELTEDNFKKYVSTFTKEIDNITYYQNKIKNEINTEEEEIEVFNYNFLKNMKKKR